MIEQESSKSAPGLGLVQAMADNAGVFIALFVAATTAVFLVPITRYVISGLVSPPPGVSRTVVIAPFFLGCLFFGIEAVCFFSLRAQARRFGAYGVLGLFARVFMSLRRADRIIVIAAATTLLLCLVAFAIA